MSPNGAIEPTDRVRLGRTAVEVCRLGVGSAPQRRSLRRRTEAEENVAAMRIAIPDDFWAALEMIGNQG